MRKSDDNFMQLALKLSRRGLGRCAPNPNVGAVVVRNEEYPIIVGRGWTMPGGRPHAETGALLAAGKLADGATLYVTLEPCSHHGKTPPCVDRIIQSGIRRVVYAAFDPDSRVAGRGINKLKQAGIEVEQASKDLVDQAEWIMQGHILRQLEKRPFVQVKLAVDAAGKVSRGDGAPVWVSCKEARERAHLMRAQSDAILVGRGTAQADNPSLTCRLPGMYNRSPIRVLLDKSLQIPVTHKIFEDTDIVSSWVFCGSDVDEKSGRALKERGAEVLPVDLQAGRLSLPQVLGKLAEKGITRLMVEGGPGIVRSFWESGFIDELVLFQSEDELGEKGIPAVEGIGLQAILNSSTCQHVSEHKIGGDWMRTYRVS